MAGDPIKSDAIEVLPFTHAQEFLAALRRSSRRWTDATGWGSDWIFRGESSDTRALVPSAWRPTVTGDVIYRHIDGWDLDDHVNQLIKERNELEEFRVNIRFLFVQTAYENSKVRAFANLVDELGLPIPGGRLPRRRPSEILEWMNHWETVHPLFALAQHHGMPTRLLDWTQNPLIAAFFAAQRTSLESIGRLVVWAANTRELAKSPVQIVTAERAQMGYLHAQQGLFTLVPSGNFLYAMNGAWPTLEQSVFPGTLTKLTLPANEGPELRRLLWLEQISKAHLMPTLDNVKHALDDFSNLAYGHAALAKEEVEMNADDDLKGSPTD